MSTDNRPFAGPRKLILIQSGKYDYAELDMTQPFQLVGVNGLGKTALISTLQYLYLDSQRDMRFGQHSTDDSRRFYFRNDSSFILFECETSIGTVTIGARGLGPTSGYELQRFSWSGGYQRQDFINSEGRPRPWDDVRGLLATKGLRVITDTVELRGLLGAVDIDTTASWGLVPLADARDYPRFRQTFQRLLQLRNLRQDDLKQLLADCAKLGPSQREIDLAKDFEKELGRITRDRSEVTILRAATPRVKEVRELYDQEYVSRAIAWAVTKELQERYGSYAADHKRHVDALIKVRDAASAEFNRLEAEKKVLQESWSKAEQESGSVRSKIDALVPAKERYASFTLEIEEQIRDRLEDEVAGIKARLADLPKEPVEVLKRQLEEKNILLAQRIEAASRLNDLFITWLRKRLPPDSIARVGALFDRRVLEGVMDEQITVADEQKLIGRLKAAANLCDARGYEDDAIGVEFPTGSVSAVGQIGKVERMQEEIRDLQRQAERLASNIETLCNAQPFRARLPVAQQEHAAQLQRIIGYQQFCEEISKEESYQASLNRWTAEAKKFEGLLTANETARNKTKSDGDEVIRRFDQLSSEDSEVRREARNMPVAEGDNPGHTPVSSEFVRTLPQPLPEIFRIARERCNQARTRAQQLNDKIGLLDRDFLNATFRYDTTAPISDRLTQLETEIASLEERSQGIENRWLGVLTDARRSFHTILKSLDDVTKQARKLNGELAQIEFSSIAEIRLEVVPNQSAFAEYDRHSKDSAQPSLFDTTEEADRKLQQFHQLLQRRPKLILNELFSLRCEVRRKDGQKNFYDDFDEVESTGTTVVLKVTLNLLVLRDLLIPGKARIPYYLDEVHSLDRQNFKNILQLSERLGFVGIYAAPTAAVGPRRFVHLVPDTNGRLVVTAAHQKDIIRTPEEAAV